MKHLHVLLRSAVLALTLGVVSANAQISDFQPVTDEVLRNPSDADWLQWRRTYDGWAGGSSSSYETFGLTPDLDLEAPRGGNTVFVFALPESE